MWLVGATELHATAQIHPHLEGVNVKPWLAGHRNLQRISRSKRIPSLRLIKQVKVFTERRRSPVEHACVPVCRTPTHNLPPQTLTYGKWQLFQFKADRQKISGWFLFDKE